MGVARGCGQHVEGEMGRNNLGGMDGWMSEEQREGRGKKKRTSRRDGMGVIGGRFHPTGACDTGGEGGGFCCFFFVSRSRVWGWGVEVGGGEMGEDEVRLKTEGE